MTEQPPIAAVARRTSGLTLSQQFPGLMLPVKAIRLSGHYGTGGHAVVDPEDYPAVRDYTWYVNAVHANRGRGLYVCTQPYDRQGRGNLSLQHLLTGYEMTGHINGDTFDNRRVNLCQLDRSLQQASKPSRPGSASRFKGVTRTRAGTWRAVIHHKRKEYYLGTHRDEEDAARAYDEKAIELFGPYAMTNQRLGLYGAPPGRQAAPGPPDRAPERSLGPEISARVVGANVRNLRLQHGWTQAILASKLGCTRSNISVIEAGKAKPSPALLSRMAGTFAVPAQALTAAQVPAPGTSTADHATGKSR
jgi:DNA-binding XRE family transcriptional regulator